MAVRRPLSLDGSRLMEVPATDRLPSDLVPRGLSGFCSGKPEADEVVAGGVAPYAFELSEAASALVALAAASAVTVFHIKLDGSPIGTATFAASGATASIDLTSTSVTEGGVLSVHAPATPDATLADIMILLREA